MFLLASVLIFLIQHQINYCETVIDGTELVLAFMVHRHGDRSPTTDTIPFGKDPEKIKELTKPYGYGQLTERGLQRSYDLGKFIRRRYDEVLSPKYNRSEIFIRSTDSTRAKMTALAAMAAVYPPEKRWEPDLNWTPTPYTIIPAKYDYNLAELSCPTLTKLIAEALHFNATDMAEYEDTYTTLRGLGYKNRGIGEPLEPEIEDVFPKIKEAAGKVWDIIYGNEKNLPLHTGVLLKEFFDIAGAAIYGKPTHRVRIQSGHDATLYPFISATHVRPRPGPLKYGALFSLELRRIIDTGKYAVLPVFLVSPEEKEQYLRIEGCDGVLCGFDKFKEITSRYLLSEDEWRKLCNFDENGPIDTSAVD